MINREMFVTDLLKYASTMSDPKEIINEMLRYLGHELDADRAYIFEEVDGVCFNNTFEWCKEGVVPQIDILQNVPYEVCDPWYKEYDKNSNIVIRDLEEYKSVSQAIYDILKPQDVNTLITAPLELDGKYIGFWGVDNPPADSLDDISAIITLLTYTMSIMIRYRNSIDEITYISMYDQLSGVCNRRVLEAKENEIHGTSSVSIMSCDINGLKKMNDTKGHAAGDQLIIDCAAALSKAFGNDNVYRIGGDEFVVLMTDESEESFNMRKEKALAYMDMYEVSVSIGCVHHPHSKYSIAQMLKETDDLMYASKDAYYRQMGTDRRGQKDAHKALCDLYTKILKINITEDTYQIIDMEESEQSEDMGFNKSISTWLSNFGKNGYVHPDDLDEYLRLTDTNYLSEYFAGNKTSLHIFYRRKFDDTFKQVMMEIIPASDYSSDNQSLYLYVKNIDA